MRPARPPSSSARFPRTARVRKRREFARLQRASARAPRPHFVLLLAARPACPAVDRVATAGPARLGIIASRRVGAATVRNRAKRLMREWFRRRRGQVPLGTDLLVIARPGAGALELSVAWAELDDALGQLRRRFERRSAGAGEPR